MIDVWPDLLVLNDGRPVEATLWPERRRELREAIIPHEYGGLPPAGTGTTAVRLSHSRPKRPVLHTHETWEVRTSFAGGGELSFTLSLWLPEVDEPRPVVLDGDGCWRTFNDEVVAAVLARGNIAASFHRTAVAADNNAAHRGTGIYRLFPEATFGVLAAWAWGYHRAVDALRGMERVRGDQIAITGHSRGGKTALLAAATDERIALANPNNSGIGGSGLHRWKVAGAEVIDDFVQAGSIVWFGREIPAYCHRDRELPYDQHFLHALVAPRALLVTEAYEDAGANPPGSYAACLAARQVYEMLGAADRLGWVVREGHHGHQPADYEALLDFIDVQFHGRPPTRDFQRELYPRLDELLRPAPAAFSAGP